MLDNALLTTFYYPLKERICISKKLNVHLERIKSKEELDVLRRYYENTLLIDRYPEDFDTGMIFPLEEIPENPDAVTYAGALAEYLKDNQDKAEFAEFSRETSGLSTIEKLIRLHLVIRFDDEGEIASLAEYAKEMRESGENPGIIMLEDEHPLVANAKNAADLCCLLSLLITHDPFEYNGLTFLLRKRPFHEYELRFDRDLLRNLNFWSIRVFVPKDKTRDNTYFDHVQEKLKLITEKIDKKFEGERHERLLHAGAILSIIEDLGFEYRVRILLLVGLMEFLLTHNPDTNRFNIEDSITKQFVLKCAMVIHKYYPKQDLNHLKKRLKEIYKERSNIAHGNFVEISRNIEKLKKSQPYFHEEIVGDLFKYVQAIFHYYIKDPSFIEFVKDN